MKNRVVEIGDVAVKLAPSEVLVIWADGDWTRDNRNASSWTDPAKDARQWFKMCGTYAGRIVRVEYGTGEVFTNPAGESK